MAGVARPASIRDPVVAFCALIAGAVALLLGPVVFPNYSGNADEPVYVLQAQALADGELTLDGDLHDGPFRPWLTGSHAGRVYTQYQPGWPLVLAAGGRLGSMRLGLALASSFLVVSAAAFAAEVFSRQRVVRSAAAATAATPLFVLHSFTWLAYGFSAGWLLLAAAVAIRAARTQRWAPAFAAGWLLGAGLLIRPFDAVLAGVVLLGTLLLHRRRRKGRDWIRSIGFAAVGSLVPLGAALAYNRVVTGSILGFPLAASSPENRFGFGPREILPAESPIDFTPGVALRALGDGLRSVPSWTALGGLGLLCAAFALYDRRLRWPTRLALLGAVAAFPLGYFFWWATALAQGGALNGLGPHYYLPSVAVLTVLIAKGAVDFVEWFPADPRLTAARLVVVGGLLMAYNLVDKVADVEATASMQERSADAVQPTGPALVLLPSEQRYVLAQNPVLANAPIPAEDDLVFGVDDGALNHEAREALARTVFRLERIWYPGDDLFSPTVDYVRIKYRRAPGLCVGLAPDANGSLVLGWDLAFFVDVTNRSINIEVGQDGELPLMYVPEDGSEWSRVLLPYGPAADPSEVEMELPSVVERGARFPASTIWLNSRNIDLMPLVISAGQCGDETSAPSE